MQPSSHPQEGRGEQQQAQVCASIVMHTTPAILKLVAHVDEGRAHFELRERANAIVHAPNMALLALPRHGRAARAEAMAAPSAEHGAAILD